MKKVMILMMMFSLAAVANPGHKNHKRGGFVEELGLTETQAEQVKSIKQQSHEKMKAFREDLQVETDAELAKVLSEEQMAKMIEMRDDRQHKMGKKMRKKHRKHKKEKAE